MLTGRKFASVLSFAANVAIRGDVSASKDVELANYMYLAAVPVPVKLWGLILGQGVARGRLSQVGETCRTTPCSGRRFETRIHSFISHRKSCKIEHSALSENSPYPSLGRQSSLKSKTGTRCSGFCFSPKWRPRPFYPQLEIRRRCAP